MQSIKQLWTGLLLALVLLQPSTPVSAATAYHVSVDTASLVGTAGFLDLQFNPGDVTAPAAMALLNGMAGDLTLNAGAVVDGSVTGALPGPLSFANDTAFNAVLQPVTFGNVFDFTINFSGAYEGALSGSGTRFSLALLDTFYNPLATVDPAGTILQFDLMPGGDVSATTFDVMLGTPSIVSLTAVPLPAALPLLFSALGVVGFMRRSAAQTPACSSSRPLVNRLRHVAHGTI